MTVTYARSEVLQGLALNKAASSEVLLRLLHPEAKAAWRWLCNRAGLPAAVVDALVTHPDWRVRGEFAQSQGAAPENRARLVDDPERRVRAELAYGPSPYRRVVEPLPDETYARLLSAPDRVVRETAAQSASIPDRVLVAYADHEDPWVRKAPSPRPTCTACSTNWACPPDGCYSSQAWTRVWSTILPSRSEIIELASTRTPSGYSQDSV